VTKLSLLLKVLEGENQDSLQRQMRLFHEERALPDLATNIKCGNSLIGPDFFDGRQMDLFEEGEVERVNAFDWAAEFPQILGPKVPKKRRGFDAVIGNPPWLMAGYYVGKNALIYLRKCYVSAEGKFDLYYLFIERASQFLGLGGRLCVIVPNKFFHTRAAGKLRAFISEGKKLRKIVDFGDERIFSGATNYSCILLLQQGARESPTYSKARRGLEITDEHEVPWCAFAQDTWYLGGDKARLLFDKIERNGKPLENLVRRFGTGVQSGADRLLVMERKEASRLRLEPDLLRPVLRGRDVRRYREAYGPKLLLFPYNVRKGQFEILAEPDLKKFRHVYKYFSEHSSELKKRVWFGKTAQEVSGHLYGLMYLDEQNNFSAPHLLTPSLSDRSNFALGAGHLFCTGTAGVTSIIPKSDMQENILYLLGLLNSALLSAYVIAHSPVFSGRFFKFSAPYLKKIPVRTIDFTSAEDRSLHDRIVELVQRMLDLSARLAKARSVEEKTRLQRLIDRTDREIDGLVYELYGLTEEEIGIVEEGTG